MRHRDPTAFQRDNIGGIYQIRPRTLAHEFLLSLHKSITPENLYAHWHHHGTTLIITADIRMFESMSLPKIRHWTEIKEMYQDFKTFAEACGFKVREKQSGWSRHTYLRHPFYLFQRDHAGLIDKITPRNPADFHGNTTVSDKQVGISDE